MEKRWPQLIRTPCGWGQSQPQSIIETCKQHKETTEEASIHGRQIASDILATRAISSTS